MKYVVGNWKSNQNLTESLIWLENMIALTPRIPLDMQVILCLPFTDIAAFNHKLSETNYPLLTGAQNVSHLPPGKHTGEITASMLRELVGFCIVGHSERRRDFGETSEEVAEKAKVLLENSITPIVCVDAPYLDKQIRELFERSVDVSHCFFAYEPLSAIGSGRPIDPSEANHIAHQIDFLVDGSAPILYGGSATADNAKSFVDQNQVDGLLVGTDSLEPTLFASIINSLK